MIEPSGSVFGDRFVLQTLIGSGGMGDVYRGHDRHFGTAVAIKLLKGPASLKLERFTREAALLAELVHPAVVRYIAHGVAPGGRAFLVMEWLEGETLEQRLRRGALSAQETWALARRVCEGLMVAHVRGIAHRDLKPANLLLVGGALAEAKILDFGIAKRVFQEHDHLTRTGGQVGTPAYMSPEQARGLAQLDVRTDIFSLGATLYECITGNAPFRGDNVLAVAAEICLQDPARPREGCPALPEAFDRLLMRALHKDPGLRHRDARELAQELIEIGEPACDSSTAKVASAPAAMLAGHEQRVVTIVIAGGVDSSEHTLEEEPEAGAGLDTWRSLLAPFGGRLESLANGMTLACFAEGDSPLDQAGRAARFALSLVAHTDCACVAICHGRAVLHGRLPIGDVVERGADLVAGATVGICLDTAAAELMTSQFEIEARPSGVRLLGEREFHDVSTAPVGSSMPFVGRKLELHALSGGFAECVEESAARGALVVATAGMGKSRLLREFLLETRRQEQPFTLLLGQGDPVRSSAPLGLLSSVVRRAAEVARGDDLELRRRKLRALVEGSLDASTAATTAEFLGVLAGIQFPDSPALQAARNDPRLMGEQIRSAWLAWLRASLVKQPVILALEDLHWADSPSVQLIDASLRSLENLPFFVLALARPEVTDRFPGLWEGRRLDLVRLLPLTPKTAERFVHEVLGARADRKLVERLVKRSEGNALFLEELIRASMAGGTQSLPDTVMAMIQARLDALGLDAARVLRAASVFGEEFAVDGVGALSGHTGGHLGEYWAVLEARELIARSDRGGFKFRHALVRETCYAALTPADRVLGHRLAGKWLEDSTDADPAVLAHHFDLGEEPVSASRWYASAATRAVQANDLTAALALAERGVALAATGETLGVLYLVQLQVFSHRGDFERAEAIGFEALQHTLEGSVAWYRVIYELCAPLGEQLEVERLVDLARRVETATPAPSAASARIACISWVAGCLGTIGRIDVAEQLFRHCESAADRGSDVEIWARHRYHRARAGYHLAKGAIAEGSVSLELARATAEASGNARDAFEARMNVGEVLVEQGMAERGGQLIAESLAYFEQAALGYFVLTATSALGQVDWQLGRLAEAREHFNTALASTNVTRIVAIARVGLARVDHDAGDLVAAEREARRAMEEADEQSPVRVSAQAVLAQVLLSLGRADEALEHASEALQSLEQLGGVQDFAGLTRLIAAEALWAVGQCERARALLLSARQHLLGRAERISDPELRHSFLHAICDHERTLRLAEEWGLDILTDPCSQPSH